MSTNFCWPVKKGWQFEQISRRYSLRVERVTKVAPHAHVTVAKEYFGWIPLRICFLSSAPASGRSAHWYGALTLTTCRRVLRQTADANSQPGLVFSPFRRAPRAFGESQCPQRVACFPLRDAAPPCALTFVRALGPCEEFFSSAYDIWDGDAVETSARRMEAAFPPEGSGAGL